MPGSVGEIESSVHPASRPPRARKRHLLRRDVQELYLLLLLEQHGSQERTTAIPAVTTSDRFPPLKKKAAARPAYSPLSHQTLVDIYFPHRHVIIRPGEQALVRVWIDELLYHEILLPDKMAGSDKTAYLCINGEKYDSVVSQLKSKEAEAAQNEETAALETLQTAQAALAGAAAKLKLAQKAQMQAHRQQSSTPEQSTTAPANAALDQAVKNAQSVSCDAWQAAEKARQKADQAAEALRRLYITELLKPLPKPDDLTPALKLLVVVLTALSLFLFFVFYSHFLPEGIAGQLLGALGLSATLLGMFGLRLNEVKTFWDFVWDTKTLAGIVVVTAMLIVLVVIGYMTPCRVRVPPGAAIFVDSKKYMDAPVAGDTPAGTFKAGDQKNPLVTIKLWLPWSQHEISVSKPWYVDADRWTPTASVTTAPMRLDARWPFLRAGSPVTPPLRTYVLFRARAANAKHDEDQPYVHEAPASPHAKNLQEQVDVMMTGLEQLFAKQFSEYEFSPQTSSEAAVAVVRTPGAVLTLEGHAEHNPFAENTGSSGGESHAHYLTVDCLDSQGKLIKRLPPFELYDANTNSASPAGGESEKLRISMQEIYDAVVKELGLPDSHNVNSGSPESYKQFVASRNVSLNSAFAVVRVHTSTEGLDKANAGIQIASAAENTKASGKIRPASAQQVKNAYEQARDTITSTLLPAQIDPSAPQTTAKGRIAADTLSASATQARLALAKKLTGESRSAARLGVEADYIKAVANILDKALVVNETEITRTAALGLANVMQETDDVKVRDEARRCLAQAAQKAADQAEVHEIIAVVRAGAELSLAWNSAWNLSRQRQAGAQAPPTGPHDMPTWIAKIAPAIRQTMQRELDAFAINKAGKKMSDVGGKDTERVICSASLDAKPLNDLRKRYLMIQADGRISSGLKAEWEKRTAGASDTKRAKTN